MNCVCGCGAELGRKQIEGNLMAAEVALELVAWDRARALGSRVETETIAAQIEAGARRYEELLQANHGEAEVGAGQAPAKEFLKSSRAARKRIHAELPMVPKNKIDLSKEEMAKLDRRHPDRTFSGAGATAPRGAPASAEELPSAPTALELELGAVLAGARDGAADFERLAVDWLGRLVVAESPTLDELRWLLGRLEDARSGRIEEAEPALRRFLAERS